MPANTKSLAYMAPPVSFAASSTRWTSSPTWVATDEMVLSDIFQSPPGFVVDLTRHVEHSFDDLLVTGASAEVAFDTLFDLGHSRLGVESQELPDRHDHPGSAITTLHRVIPGESRLDL